MSLVVGYPQWGHLTICCTRVALLAASPAGNTAVGLLTGCGLPAACKTVDRSPAGAAAGDCGL